MYLSPHFFPNTETFPHTYIHMCKDMNRYVPYSCFLTRGGGEMEIPLDWCIKIWCQNLRYTVTLFYEAFLRCLKRYPLRATKKFLGIENVWVEVMISVAASLGDASLFKWTEVLYVKSFKMVYSQPFFLGVTYDSWKTHNFFAKLWKCRMFPVHPVFSSINRKLQP